MKIFYGVQGTGNGHITRARAIAPKLRAAGAEVTWLFSGRPREDFFEMEVFGDYLWRAGLTFQTRHGHVHYLRTALRNNLVRFVDDIRSLDLRGYDRVITDFEPVTAWAARLRGIPTVGIGHQYAFGLDIPKAGADLMGTQVLKYFAPASVGLGVHWHHFNGPILPPIIEAGAPPAPQNPAKIIVYLPFEDIDDVIRLLRPFTAYEFHVYNPGGPVPTSGRTAHIQIKGLSLRGFRATWRHEEAFRQEVYLFVVAGPLGLWLGETGVEKALLVGSLILVMIVELLNTGIEIVVDRISFERHELSGRAKDVGSAAVLSSLALAGLVWGLILWPRLAAA